MALNWDNDNKVMVISTKSESAEKYAFIQLDRPGQDVWSTKG